MGRFQRGLEDHAVIVDVDLAEEFVGLGFARGELEIAEVDVRVPGLDIEAVPIQIIAIGVFEADLQGVAVMPDTGLEASMTGRNSESSPEANQSAWTDSGSSNRTRQAKRRSCDTGFPFSGAWMARLRLARWLGVPSLCRYAQVRRYSWRRQDNALERDGVMVMIRPALHLYGRETRKWD